MGNSLSFLWMLLQTIFALLLVCGLAYLIFRIILPKLAVNYGSNSMVRIVDRIGLESRKSLYVVEVAGKWMLVGSSENGLQLISELDAKTAKEAESEIANTRQTSGTNQLSKTFSNKFDEIMKRNQGGK